MKPAMIAATAFAVAVAIAPSPGGAQDEGACPLHAAHQAAQGAADPHHAAVDERHDQATGVSHASSVHHFDLDEHGGVIRLEATGPADKAGRDHIRAHLSRIAADFREGRFDLPMQVHDQTPPGVAAMTRLESAIRYRYVPTARGGRVEIRTDDPEARDAVHEFLRFQIEEHRTGDPLEVRGH